jgi:hypothetical protein
MRGNPKGRVREIQKMGYMRPGGLAWGRKVKLTTKISLIKIKIKTLKVL